LFWVPYREGWCTSGAVWPSVGRWAGGNKEASQAQRTCSQARRWAWKFPHIL
jgi:hypothetical protein